jgi:DNA repair ATPase RecN
MATRLRSVGVNAGFLEKSRVEFADGLTCIIGARGTCKSTLIETIRFVFDSNPDQIEVLTGINQSASKMPQFKLITATLGAGTARCAVEQSTGDDVAELVLEREVGDATRIFVNDVREHANRDVLHEIEIYSQGDLQRLAEDDNDDLRLALIDRPNRVVVKELREELGKWTNDLRAIGPELRGLRAQKATLRHEVMQLDTYSAQLQRARDGAPEATPELETERAAYEKRQRILDELRRLEQTRVSLVENLGRALAPMREAAEAIERLGALAPAEAEIASALESLKGAVGALASADLRLKSLSLTSAFAALTAKFEEQSATYYRLRQEQQAVNESLKQQQVLQRQIEHLTRQSDQLKRIEEEEKGLLDRRREARRNLSSIEDKLYELRIKEVDAINTLHSATVQLELIPYTATLEYVRQLGVLLTGSRIRAQDEVAQAIAQKLSPGELIDIVEAANAQHLADVLARDLGQMTRVVSHLADAADLYSLEAELPSAKLEIVLYDDGQPKRVEELSKGQKATALLPIILRDLPYPLLFDQPEDDLDNSFIFRTLIKAIHVLKERRQLIFVTHNANIPVLGGADRVVVMRMATPIRAAAPKTGSVDKCKQDILDLLEGGAEAFAAREEQYHPLLVRESGRSSYPSRPATDGQDR